MTDHDKAPHEELLVTVKEPCSCVLMNYPKCALCDSEGMIEHTNWYETAVKRAAAIRDLQARLNASREVNEVLRRDADMNCTRATAAEQALAKRDEILRRWLKHTTESAGMTPAIVHDKAAFQKFLDDIDNSEAQLIEDTNRALPQEPAAGQVRSGATDTDALGTMQPASAAAHDEAMRLEVKK